MKRTIFVCLLSLALTFSVTADETGKLNDVKPSESSGVSTQKSEKASVPSDGANSPIPASPTTPTPVQHEAEGQVNNSKSTSNGITLPKPVVTESNVISSTPASSEIISTPKSDVPEGQVSTSASSNGTPSPKPVVTESNVISSTPASSATTKSEPESKTTDGKNKSGDKPVSEKTTEASKTVTVKPEVIQGRTFDGASFIGGIILTLGLIAVGFIGFKYYKARTERNYHTL